MTPEEAMHLLTSDKNDLWKVGKTWDEFRKKNGLPMEKDLRVSSTSTFGKTNDLFREMKSQQKAWEKNLLGEFALGSALFGGNTNNSILGFNKKNKILGFGMHGQLPELGRTFRSLGSPVTSYRGYRENNDTPKKKEAVKKVVKKAVESLVGDHERQCETIMEIIKELGFDPVNIKWGEKAKTRQVWTRRYFLSDYTFDAAWKVLCDKKRVYSLHRTRKDIFYK